MYRGTDSRPQDGEADELSLIRAYNLADRLCMEELNNRIMNTLYQYYASNYITTTRGITLLAEKGLGGGRFGHSYSGCLPGDIVETGNSQMLLKVPDLKDCITAGGDGVFGLFETSIGRTEDELEVSEMDGEDKCRWHAHLETPVCPGAKTHGDGKSKKPDTKGHGAA